MELVEAVSSPFLGVGIWNFSLSVRTGVPEYRSSPLLRFIGLKSVDAGATDKFTLLLFSLMAFTGLLWVSFLNYLLLGLRLLHFSLVYCLISSLMSGIWSLASLVKKVPSLNSSRSSGSESQVRISIPLSFCLSKLSLMLSTIIVFLISLPSLLRSLT